MPDPIEAGYWPYNTVDGHLAAGDPGATGMHERKREMEKERASGEEEEDVGRVRGVSRLSIWVVGGHLNPAGGEGGSSLPHAVRSGAV